ncbi:MAG: phosphotransferase [Alphaproteobacteria bacterium]|nr:phosphotransferase [Alphaproteobacteria bacterium]
MLIVKRFNQLYSQIIVLFWNPRRDGLSTVSVDITCTLLQNLHTAPIPMNHDYPHLSYWLRALDKSYDDPTGKLAQHLIKARILRDQLLTTAPPDVLLHGDLHHDNILFDEGKGGYTVIDPKGVVGDPAYDTAVFMFNPLPDLLNDPNPMDILKKRIHHFSKSLTMDPIRIHSCAYIHAVMSACWSMEDHEDPSYSIKVADILSEILSTP